MSSLRFDDGDDGSPMYRVYVGILSWNTDERSLKDALADYGACSAEIVRDRDTGRSHMLGFVTFEDSKSMKDAIEGMNGQELDGRKITVSQVKQRTRI